ncbi:MAG TPA: aldo/keto reductase [Gaiellaceae bacterium]|jgi:aryl-alcohol dehydrogenase-like predicted oxidoreductase|nr:aldo/keto reductase [Gaiellaceae bacterium]
MTAFEGISLGCGNFGGVGSSPAFFGQGIPEDEAQAIMDHAWASGIRWFDTADAYGGGRSESFIGRWRADRRPEGLRITTKTFNPMDEGADRGLAPDRIRRQLEGSLERLGVDRVDLYLAHEPDPDTPLAASVETFEALVAEGLVGAWGVSNFGVDLLRETLALGRPALVQNSFSLLDRGDEEALLPLCLEEGISYVPFGPLAGGWLTGKYRRDEPYPEGSRMTQRPEPYQRLVADRVFDGLDRLREEAAARGVELATLAFAWVLATPGVTGAVCGPSRAAHLDPVLAARELQLDAVDHQRIGGFFS